MGYVAKFNITDGTLPQNMNNVLIYEFVKRRDLAVDQFNPMYEQWNEEFHLLYPNADGYSEEYSNFIRDKQKDGLALANSKTVGLDLLELKIDGDCDIYGVTRLFDHTEIHLYLEEE